MTRPLFLGSDVAQSPDVDLMLATARTLAKADYTGGAVSARYGARFCTTAGGIPFEAIDASHVTEVVDYDPHVDHILCIGPHPPGHLAPIHGLIFRAKREVGAIVQVDLPANHPLRAKAPAIALGRTHLEGSLKVLEALRGATLVQYGKTAVLSVGRTLDEAARPFLPGGA